MLRYLLLLCFLSFSISFPNKNKYDVLKEFQIMALRYYELQTLEIGDKCDYEGEALRQETGLDIMNFAFAIDDTLNFKTVVKLLKSLLKSGYKFCNKINFLECKKDTGVCDCQKKQPRISIITDTVREDDLCKVKIGEPCYHPDVCTTGAECMLKPRSSLNGTKIREECPYENLFGIDEDKTIGATIQRLLSGLCQCL